jgi:hypothetical protein
VINKIAIDIRHYESRKPFLVIFLENEFNAGESLSEIEALAEFNDWNLFSVGQYLRGIEIGIEGRVRLLGRLSPFLGRKETVVWGHLYYR